MDESSEAVAGTDRSAQEVGLTLSPPPYVEDDEMKSVESIIDERLLPQA